MGRGAMGRNGWADVVKGISIVLVVLWHVTSKSYLQLPWQPDELGLEIKREWYVANRAAPIRMPLFFLVSGIFAARVLNRPWPKVWTGRVAPLFYLLLVWTAIQSLFFVLTPGVRTTRATSLTSYLDLVFLHPSNLWYLLALPLYVLVARATRAVPWLALLGALALHLAVNLGHVTGEGNQNIVLASGLWFLLGTRLDEHRLRAVLGRVRLPVALGLLALFVLAVGVRRAHDTVSGDLDSVLSGLAVISLGVVAGFALGGALARGSRLGAATASVGTRTLAIYVIHLPVLAVVDVVAVRLLSGPARGLADSHLTILLYPALATAVVVAVALLVHRLLVAVGCWWLFSPPWQPPRVVAEAGPGPRHRA